MTPKAPVEAALAPPRRPVRHRLAGTQQLAESAREDLVSIFILPPSTRELERRLRPALRTAPRRSAGAWPSGR